eukprot:COSAG05_NODE_548_length_8749_cov_33.055838_8_plen_96_part_00
MGHPSGIYRSGPARRLLALRKLVHHKEGTLAAATPSLRHEMRVLTLEQLAQAGNSQVRFLFVLSFSCFLFRSLARLLRRRRRVLWSIANMKHRSA